MKALWTLRDAASGPGRLPEGQTATDTPESHYSNLPCVVSQSSNSERETKREREAAKTRVKEHRTFVQPDSLIDGCREKGEIRKLPDHAYNLHIAPLNVH